MEAGTLTTALVVEAAVLVPNFAPFRAPPTVVFATVTQPDVKSEIMRKTASCHVWDRFMVRLRDISVNCSKRLRYETFADHPSD